MDIRKLCTKVVMLEKEIDASLTMLRCMENYHNNLLFVISRLKTDLYDDNYKLFYVIQRMMEYHDHLEEATLGLVAALRTLDDIREELPPEELEKASKLLERDEEDIEDGGSPERGVEEV